MIRNLAENMYIVQTLLLANLLCSKSELEIRTLDIRKMQYTNNRVYNPRHNVTVATQIDLKIEYC